MEGECAIFDDVIPLFIESVKRLASTIKNSSTRVKQSAFAVVAVIAIMASLTYTGVRIAYKVNYSGNIIATVSSKKQFDDALALVVSLVGGRDVESVVEQPKFSATMALNKNINNTEEVANAIINNTDEIVEAATLTVNGNAMLHADKDFVERSLKVRLNSFNVEGFECTSRFASKVECMPGYFMVSQLDTNRRVEDVISSLAVITEVKETSDVVVPYESVVEETDKQSVNYASVKVAGVSGISRTTKKVVMLNGIVQSTEEIGTQVVVPPVNEVIIRGTAKIPATAEELKQASSAGFIFPLPTGTWGVSAYYGDGRNHKGVDLYAPSGTSIYAVAGGTVVFSGWKGAYGNCVIIEHANGMRTLYAHARQVCCSVGDTVSQGEVIALVGTTGQSTGNHLHFEVIVSGRNVDPAPYINLR